MWCNEMIIWNAISDKINDFFLKLMPFFTKEFFQENFETRFLDWKEK